MFLLDAVYCSFILIYTLISQNKAEMYEKFKINFLGFSLSLNPTHFAAFEKREGKSLIKIQIQTTLTISRVRSHKSVCFIVYYLFTVLYLTNG